MHRLIFCGGLLLLIATSQATAGLGAACGMARTVQSGFGFSGTIMNGTTQRPVVADIVIYGTGAEPVGKLQTSRSGTFTMTAETAGPYRFVVSALGYVPREVTVSVLSGAATAFTVVLVPLDVGTKVTLHSIRFAQSQATLLPESFEELTRLADLLLANEQMEIQVNGHTDNQGDPAQNVLLSEHRVRAVQDYLVKKGVAVSRLRAKGFGGSEPIASNKQEYTRKLNRRVEFEILKK
ncbi:MAG: OmpA family protein [Hymenobacteraceae bacterium]|nr:OmpA family protein [Hymenobacteraceae bacterium]